MVAQDQAKLICYLKIKHQRPDIDNIHLYVKNQFESNCLLTEKKK